MKTEGRNKMKLRRSERRKYSWNVFVT